jgi:hypothetical protein
MQRTKKDKDKKKKGKWGGKRIKIEIYKYHEEWAKKNGYRK